MKHYLSRIRIEAARLYAEAHPDIRLKDIGHALGRRTLFGLGLNRPGGGSSPAYDFKARSKKMRAYYDSKMIDRTLLKNLLAEGKTYAQIAELTGGNKNHLQRVGKQLGYRRRTFFGVNDAAIHDYLAKHPDADLATMAPALGYKSIDSLRYRLNGMGIYLRSHSVPLTGKKRRVDWNLVRKLAADRSISYAEIAAQAGCSERYAAAVAHSGGIYRGKRKTRKPELAAYLKRNKDATLEGMARDFGYSVESLYGALLKHRLRVPHRESPRPSSANKKLPSSRKPPVKAHLSSRQVETHKDARG